MEMLQVGDPFHKDTEQGPQVDEEQFNKVLIIFMVFRGIVNAAAFFLDYVDCCSGGGGG